MHISFIEFKKKLIKTLVVANHTLNFNNISVSNAKKIKFKFFYFIPSLYSMITRNLWHRKTTFRLWVFFNWISDLISYLLIFFVCFLEHLIHCCTVVFQYHSLIILTVTKYLILIKLTISTKKNISSYFTVNKWLNQKKLKN